MRSFNHMPFVLATLCVSLFSNACAEVGFTSPSMIFVEQNPSNDAKSDTPQETDADASDAVGDVSNGVRLGGQVVGLVGSGLAKDGPNTLTLRSGDQTVVVQSSGSFAFPTALEKGAAYSVQIDEQPKNPARECVVLQGEGVAGDTDIDSVFVNCEPKLYALGGKVSGLPAGASVTLRLNNTMPMSVAASTGVFVFPTLLPTGTDYAVAVVGVPAGYKCVAANAQGTIETSNILAIQVQCEADTYKLSVDVSGYFGKTPLVVSRGSESLSITANGVYAFAESLPIGSPYSVVVAESPMLPWQTCSVGTTETPATGLLGVATKVKVRCATNEYKIKGAVRGMREGSTLVLARSDGATLDVTSNGSFTFAETVASDTEVTVSVRTQPGKQKCYIDNASKKSVAADEAVSVTCYDDVRVSATGNARVTNIPVRVTLTPNNFDYNRAQPKGEDLRFYQVHGGPAVPYYIEQWNVGGTSKVWVKIPVIEANDGVSLLMFAGDVLLTAASCGDDTFAFYDDFRQGVVDATKWEFHGTPSEALVRSGSLSFRGNGNWEYARSRSAFVNGIVTMEFTTQGPTSAPVIGVAGSDERYTFRATDNGHVGTNVDTDVSGGNSWLTSAYPGVARTDGTLQRIEMTLSSTEQGLQMEDYCNVTKASCAGALTLAKQTSARKFFVGVSSNSSFDSVQLQRVFVRPNVPGVFQATVL